VNAVQKLEVQHHPGVLFRPETVPLNADAGVARRLAVVGHPPVRRSRFDQGQML